MKYVTFEMEKQTWYLAYTAEAMFQIQEMETEQQDIFTLLQQENQEGIVCISAVLEILANCGERLRRHEGYDKGPMMDRKDMALRMRPYDLAAARRAILKAIAIGFLREVPDDDKELDLGLLELEKKTN